MAAWGNVWSPSESINSIVFQHNHFFLTCICLCALRNIILRKNSQTLLEQPSSQHKMVHSASKQTLKKILISPPFILIKTFSPCFYSDFVDVCVCACVCDCSVQSSCAFPLVIFFQRIKVDFPEIPITIISVLAIGHPWACWGVAWGGESTCLEASGTPGF